MRASLLAGPVLFVLFAAPISQARRRAYVWVPPLVATDASQAIQNERANQYHLARLRNLAMVQEFRAEGLLVSVPSRMPYYYLHTVSADYSYLRPWSKLFLDQLSRDYYARFRQPLRITSMLRTVYVQREMTRWNPNAADAVGADRSSHLTGATLDISKHGMNYRGELWMRQYLVRMERAGYLYAIEEFHEPCFHVMVFPTYRQSPVTHGQYAVEHARVTTVARHARPVTALRSATAVRAAFVGPVQKNATTAPAQTRVPVAAASSAGFTQMKVPAASAATAPVIGPVQTRALAAPAAPAVPGSVQTKAAPPTLAPFVGPVNSKPAARTSPAPPVATPTTTAK